MKAVSVMVNLIVKADNADDAESIVANRLNRWFLQDEAHYSKEGGFPRGSLLFWCVASASENASPVARNNPQAPEHLEG